MLHDNFIIQIWGSWFFYIICNWLYISKYLIITLSSFYTSFNMFTNFEKIPKILVTKFLFMTDPNFKCKYFPHKTAKAHTKIFYINMHISTLGRIHRKTIGVMRNTKYTIILSCIVSKVGYRPFFFKFHLISEQVDGEGALLLQSVWSYT